MPELPEVETTLCGIKPHIASQRIKNISVRNFNLRWPIPKNIADLLKNQSIIELQRRGKYLLLKFKTGTLLLHLGMSGSLRIVTKTDTIKKHDHVDIEFENKKILRYTDPRRFGAILWTDQDPLKHVLLKNLGPEPLEKDFSADYLFKKTKKRKTSIKSFIMDSKIVVGVGNIYATESLFLANIHPTLPANQLSLDNCKRLTQAIKKILQQAITKGGTTLKDFVKSDGKPGYFTNSLKVYGRANLPCVNCKTTLVPLRIGQRSTVFCPKCQS